MTDIQEKNITEEQLAHIGEGVVAYVREIESDDLRARFPSLPKITPGTRLWAVFAANGTPILLSDKRDSAFAGAFQNELTPVAVH